MLSDKEGRAASAPRDFPLGIAPFTYADLYSTERLRDLLHTFDEALLAADATLAEAFFRHRAERQLTGAEESDLLIRVAEHVGPFVARLFRVERELAELTQASTGEAVLFDFKRDYIARRVRKRFAPGTPVAADEAAYLALERELGGGEPDAELRAARTAMALLRIHLLFERPSDGKPGELEAAEKKLVELLRRLDKDASDPKLALASLLDVIDRWHGARIGHTHWLSYHQPKALDSAHAELVPILRRKAGLPEAIEGPDETRRARDGFRLTDRRMSGRETLGEVHYCLYCHDRKKDSCRTGLVEKSGATKKNPLGIPLEGCPLEERISEAHWLKKGGQAIGALAMICVDNPMLPGTGHRICNDCMKACIYQKQEPVNIPQIETRILTDVLRVPYGYEIYALLTRWNPLNLDCPSPKPYAGRNVLVVGLGPAGYTLAQHLLNQGFGVVGIDGLKIEPLPADLAGTDAWPPRAVVDFKELEEELDERVLLGFGGVAEYGITVRWDKNFLKLIYLTLARREMFRCYGGVRFGGTLTLEDSWALGFHHIAIAAGAGRPTIVDMKNNLINGMRQASDFLMGLQLTGAYKKSSLANLQVELPALVIGGGLTAIDTATELAAYYPVQIEKLLDEVERLGEAKVQAVLDEEQRTILGRMLAHARELREEKQKASPDIPALVQKWGGVALCYRRSLLESPAYRLNHEEVQKCLEEGITFIENLSPTEAVGDRFGHLDAVKFARADKSEVTFPARTLMVAAGTTPNIIYEKEHPGTFQLDEQRKFFKAHKLEDGVLVPASKSEDGFFTSYSGPDHRYVTFYGDNHPRYAGSVVKAMASARAGQHHVSKLFEGLPPVGTLADWKRLAAKLDLELLCRVHEVRRLTPTIIEVIVKAPLQARKFQPGQFFRFQNFESQATQVEGAKLTMEGIALTGAWVDREQGLLSLIALEVGVSSKLCAMLRPGEPVVVMGPTGTPTEIPRGESVVLAGGGLGNAVLFSVAKALKDNGNRVIYFAAYRRKEDVFKRQEIELASDQVVWSVDGGPPIDPARPSDRTFVGNVVQAMQAYAGGAIADPMIGFKQVDRIIAIGSDKMMAAVTRARKAELSAHLRPEHHAIASINSPMQCMMKEVCAQCLQRHVDPKTGAESFVFSCFNQDQPADRLDWNNLAARLKQNTLLERVANLRLERMLAAHPLPRA
jgi:NAD(P)H-flavin reductase/NADPH-dependent glutamate synthase beta subunit-like oxidoreductase